MQKELYINIEKYKIDDIGNVYSNSTGKWLKMSPITNPHGYLTLGLTDKNGTRKTYFIHRLVYTAFNNLEYEGDYDVHHINYNKKNCSLTNLQKMTHSENVDDYFSKIYKNKPTLKCKVCGKKLHGGKTMCAECTLEKRRDMSSTPKDKIIEILKENNGNFKTSAKFFNLTDNGLRKRCKRYGLPTKSSNWKNKR